MVHSFTSNPRQNYKPYAVFITYAINDVIPVTWMNSLSTVTK